MALPSFYTPELLQAKQSLNLSEQEVRHAAVVKRLSIGQCVRVFNGLGLVGVGKISEMSKRSVVILVDSTEEQSQSKHCLSMAVAVPKGDRQRVLVDMLTQLGVAKIRPLDCEFSATKFNYKLKEKWQRWAIEACKQSQNPWLPEITEAISLQELLHQKHRFLVADQGGELFDPADCQKEALFLVGPEGGFSASEQTLLSTIELKKVRFAQHILRTEAAAICAAGLWSAYSNQ